MASLNLFISPIVTPQRRVVRSGATSSKGSRSGTTSTTEEKGILDFILGGLAKQEQIYETNPILKKVEEKNGGTTTTARKNGGTTSTARKNTQPPPPAKKKEGGFGLGGFFPKK